MRVMGMISAVLVLIAVSIAIKSLTAFGFGSWQIVEILVPMGIGVAVFFAGVTYLGLWSVRRLNRSTADSPERKDGREGKTGED